MYLFKPWNLFWAAGISAAAYFFFALFQKWRFWSRGLPSAPRGKVPLAKIAAIWISETLFHRQLFGLSLSRWGTHLLIFWGFLGLAFLSFFSGTIKVLSSLGWDGSVGSFLFSGSGYRLTKIWGDLFGLALLSGILLTFVRRFLLRPRQVLNEQTDIVLLILLFWLTLSGFLLEGFRLKFIVPEMVRYSFVGRFFVPSGPYTIAEFQPWLSAAWSLHAFSGLGLMAYLPHSKLLHSIVAPLVIAQNAAEEHNRKDVYWPETKKFKATR